MDHADGSRRPHGPRLYHKKSRFGCLRCKARRVKCDEKRPSCSGCSRHMVDCVYPSAVDLGINHTPATASMIINRKRSRPEDDNGVKLPPAARPAADIVGGVGEAAALSESNAHAHATSVFRITDNSNSQEHDDRYNDVNGSRGGRNSHNERKDDKYGNQDGDDDGDGDDAALRLPETRARRLTELRLLHHYLLNQSMTFGRPLVPRKCMEAAASSNHPSGMAFPPATTSSMSPASAETPASNSNAGGHTSTTSSTSRRTRDSNRSFVWSVDLVSMAFKNDSILYAVLAHAALSIWVGADGGWNGDDSESEQDPEADDEAELDEAALAAADAEHDARRKDRHRLLQQQYLAMALRAQRRAVDNLSRATADSICIASLMLLNHSFALVQTLPVSPWQPPIDWLQMGRGAFQVLVAARAYLSENGYATADPGIDSNLNDAVEGPGRRSSFDHGEGGNSRNVGSSSQTSHDTQHPHQHGVNCHTHQALCHILHTNHHHQHNGQNDQNEQRPDRDSDRSNEPSGAGAGSVSGPSSGPTQMPNRSLNVDGTINHNPGPEPDAEAKRHRTTNRFIHTPPRFDPDEIFAPSNAEPYLYLLDLPAGVDVDRDSPADLLVYRRVLCYIGWCAVALFDDPINALCRRFAGAAYFFPSELQGWLNERRPRALVLLAHFFALWIPFQHIWMIGPTGPKQVRAIYGELPAAWRPRLATLIKEHGLFDE